MERVLVRDTVEEDGVATPGVPATPATPAATGALRSPPFSSLSGFRRMKRAVIGGWLRGWLFDLRMATRGDDWRKLERF